MFKRRGKIVRQKVERNLGRRKLGTKGTVNAIGIDLT